MGASHIRGFLQKSGKQCFLLKMYRFCGNNALYSLYTARLWYAVLIFLWTPFDTWDCYYFESNLYLVLHIKMLFIKKACNFVLQSSKHEEITFPHEFTPVFILYSIGAILSKNVVKSGGFGKKYKRGICKSHDLWDLCLLCNTSCWGCYNLLWLLLSSLLGNIL